VAIEMFFAVYLIATAIAVRGNESAAPGMTVILGLRDLERHRRQVS